MPERPSIGGLVLVAATACAHGDEVERIRERQLGTSGFLQCDRDHARCGESETCFDIWNDPAHCGADCLSCPAPPAGKATCVDGGCGFQCQSGFHLSNDGECIERPGCLGFESACGGDDCCRQDRIAENGHGVAFQRGYDQSDDAAGLEDVWRPQVHSEKVELAVFDMDRYEVTVGRFRRFLDAYDDWRGCTSSGSCLQPRPGNAAHPDPALAESSGWQLAWTQATGSGPEGETALLPADAEAIRAGMLGCPAHTFTAFPEEQETHPINCLTFFEAFLFCMWDQARLPTEAEWHAAASGGGQQRPFPWSGSGGTSLTDTAIPMGFARHDQGDGSPLPVGSTPDGAGRWGTQDLAGNVYEWVRDTEFADGACGEGPAFGFGLCDYAEGPKNPLETRDDTVGPNYRHVLRGGSYKMPALRLRNVARELRNGLIRIADIGFRCVRPRASR